MFEVGRRIAQRWSLPSGSGPCISSGASGHRRYNGRESTRLHDVKLVLLHQSHSLLPYEHTALELTTR